jgi:hypothetical protein
MMFETLMKRVAERAGAVAEAALDAVEMAVAEFPDVMVEREGDAIVIRGRGLLRRWLDDARLRFSLRGLW